MLWNDIYISSVATSLGQKEKTSLAVSEGRYDAKENELNDYLAVRVAGAAPAIDMAVEAAVMALDRSPVSPDEIDLIAHASIGHQGLDHFAPASYVQAHAVGGHAPALEIKQFSNGALVSIEIAAAFLMARPAPSSALLTSSDKFVPPTYDRYRSDKGIVFGDGGTAVVLSRGSGVARLLSTAMISDGTYGAVYIGDEQWSEVSQAGGKAIDLRARREQFLANNAGLLMKVVEAATARQRESVEIALADAHIDSGDVNRWVFLNVGQTQVDREFRKLFGVKESSTTWQWGREVGHLGAGDQVAGLSYLLESRQVHRGDHIALCSMGMGFSYGCVVVEILDEPDWSNSAD